MKLVLAFSFLVIIVTAHVADAAVGSCYTCGWSTTPCTEETQENLICPPVGDLDWVCGHLLYTYSNGTILNRKACFPNQIEGMDFCGAYNTQYNTDGIVSMECGWCNTDLCN